MGCMRRPALHGVVMIALGACVALAAAQNGHRGVGDRDASAMDETTGSTTNRAPAELKLSDEQRGRIYESVMRIPDTPVAQAPGPAVADALPAGVPMQDLPAGLTREIPLVHGHKFVKFDDRIVVVNPASRLVVAMIPRYKLLP
ncbi:MAG TPA: hypothetical protein VHJ16_10530 [Xanthobacteraceae bacterium]|jgi:hypothetical protein|nr:hypothetical protein [Xanthobacteraceae bacterium]